MENYKLLKKKILFIIDSLKLGGGTERVLANLTLFLSKNFEISILTWHHFKNLYDFNGKYFSLKENTGLLKNFLQKLKIFTLLRPFRIFKFFKIVSPNLIISIGESANFNMIITKFFFRINFPLIISIRNNPNELYKNNRIIKFLIKLFYNLKIVDKIITVSKELQLILEKDYYIKRNKLVTIYNGIDLKKIQELNEHKIQKYSDIFYDEKLVKFVTLGSLMEKKAHGDLIKAYSIVKKAIPSSKLIIIGDGPFRNKLRMLINNLKLKNDVMLLGLQLNPFKFLKASDIFIFTSKWEGFPNVLIEAMACGLPIISTNCKTGPKEILQANEYGFLVEVEDIEEIAKKMILLAKNPNLIKKFSKKSLHRVKFYTFEKILQQWIKLIEQSII